MPFNFHVNTQENINVIKQLDEPEYDIENCADWGARYPPKPSQVQFCQFHSMGGIDFGDADFNY